jgi:hypothetical protein
LINAVSFANACRRLHNHGASLVAKHAAKDLRHDVEATIDASDDFFVTQNRTADVADETGTNLIGAVDTTSVALTSHRNGDERAGASIVILTVKETGGLRSLTRIAEGIPGSDDFLARAGRDLDTAFEIGNGLLADTETSSDRLLVIRTIKHGVTDGQEVIGGQVASLFD